jgi:hypothetical protein
MTYPDHYLLSWGGSLHGTETWSNGVRLRPNTNFSLGQAEIDAFMADTEKDLNNFYSQDFFHVGMKCEWVKLNRIGPLGRYVSTETSNTRFFAVPKQGVAGAAHPAQIALVATLLTDAERGLANKGRLYLAGLSTTRFPINALTGDISVAARDAFRAHVGNFLNNINNEPGLDANGAGFDIHVVSKGSGARDGVARKVTGVKIGRVLDTQRRRREDLAEDYGPVLAVS